MRSSKKELRDTYAVIDLNNLVHNINLLKDKCNSNIMAIVKADAYGHGAKKIAEYACSKCNIQSFGVATIYEGIELRKHLDKKGLSPDITILGYFSHKAIKDVIQWRLLPNIFDINIARVFNEYLSKHSLTYPVTLKIDTGMNRIGFDKDISIESFKLQFPHLRIDHIMTHMSSSDADEEYTNKQLNNFNLFIKNNNIANVKVSAFNSAAIVRHKNIYNLVRSGSFLYGYVLCPNDLPLRRVMSVYSKIIQIKKLSKGDFVSYSNTYQAKSDILVGVVPMGYADGYPLSLSNKGYMLVCGVKCPVIGRVCMDMTMLDITAVGERAYGSTVEILGDNITAKDLALLTNTNEYAVTIGISSRVPRIYKYEEE